MPIDELDEAAFPPATTLSPGTLEVPHPAKDGSRTTQHSLDGSPDAVRAVKDGQLVATGQQSAVLISQRAVETGAE